MHWYVCKKIASTGPFQGEEVMGLSVNHLRGMLHVVEAKLTHSKI